MTYIIHNFSSVINPCTFFFSFWNWGLDYIANLSQLNLNVNIFIFTGHAVSYSVSSVRVILWDYELMKYMLSLSSWNMSDHGLWWSIWITCHQLIQFPNKGALRSGRPKRVGNYLAWKPRDRREIKKPISCMHELIFTSKLTMMNHAERQIENYKIPGGEKISSTHNIYGNYNYIQPQ